MKFVEKNSGSLDTHLAKSLVPGLPGFLLEENTTTEIMIKEPRE